jgi:NADH:ubiquinone oxidoreductase subunit 5 (subunit L)/multisubunit Na+/H+ antiporter MnhA subunit
VNGFFSKELIFDAALETGKVFYLCGLAGALLTGLAFLRLGHAVFFGKPSTATANVKEAPALMLAPMLLISAGCLLFGLMPSLPLDRMIVPAVQGWLGTEHHSYSGFPANGLLVAASLVVIAFAVVFQLIAGRRNAAGSLDPVVKAPVIGGLYGLAERKAFDPYDLTARVGGWFARLLWGIDRVVDGLYDKVVTGLTLGLSTVLGRIHTGSYVASIVWALFAGVALVLVLVKLT